MKTTYTYYQPKTQGGKKTPNGQGMSFSKIEI